MCSRRRGACTAERVAESFRDLEVWQHAMEVAVAVDALVDQFARPGNELRYQMLKASMSIPFNIAEGYRRRSRAAYVNHVSIAMGSQGELDSQLEYALRTRRLSPQQIAAVADLNGRVGRMLFRLWQSLATGRS